MIVEESVIRIGNGREALMLEGSRGSDHEVVERELLDDVPWTCSVNI